MSSLANPPLLHQAIVLESASSSSSATSSNASTNQTRTRVRTGCLNCRRKHKKCDEHKPVCHGCISKNEACEWPVPKLKKSSRRSSIHYTTAPVGTTGLLHHTPVQQNSVFPAQGFRGATQLGMNYTPPPLPQATVFPPAGSLSMSNPHARKLSTDLFSYSLAQRQPQPQPPLSDAHSAYSSSSAKDDTSGYSPRNYQLSTALPMMRSESVEIKSKRLSTTELSQLSDLSKVLETYLITGSSSFMTTASPLFIRDEDQMSLTAHYLSRVAPSLDIDDQMLFSEHLPLLMRHEPALLYSAMSLSALTSDVTITTTTPFMLFRYALTQFLATRRSSDQPTKEQLMVREATLLFLTLFLHHHSQHKLIVHHLNSSTPSITFHLTLLRLTLSQFIIPDQASTDPPHKILPLLSIHQQDFLTSFSKATTHLSELSTILEKDSQTSTFPQILLPPRSIHTHILLTTAIVRLLSHKPMDVQVRSHPVAYYAKRLCGIIETNKSRVPWYAHWCLFTAGKVFTHDSEHKEVIKIMNALGKSEWEAKMRDYWEGRGDV